MLGALYQAFGYQSAFLLLNRPPALYPGFVKFSWENYTGINDQDQVVGGGGTFLYLWQNGKKALMATCPTDCIAVSLNNLLQVVITAQATTMLYTNGSLYDLPSLIQNGSDWNLPYGPRLDLSYRINDVGQIAGIGILNNKTHAFRLDPVPSVSQAIEKMLYLLSSVHPNLGRRITPHWMNKLALASKLNDALTSWDAGNPAATRGYLNEFESLVRAQTGQTLTAAQAKQLLDLAEAAIALTWT